MTTQGGSRQYGERAGFAKRFRRVVELQSNNPSTGNEGGLTDNWETVVESLRCEITTKPGIELTQRNAVVSIATSFVTFRYRSALTITPEMRFVLPSGRILNIVGIADPDESRRVFVAQCTEGLS